MMYQILRLFVNPLSAEDKHYLLNKNKLMLPIQMQLSQKQKTFSEFFFGFSKSMLIFKHFPKSHDPHSRCISGNTGSEKHV